MALTITVGGSNISQYVQIGSLVIEETADEMVATCRFEVHDASDTVSIDPKGTVSITDGATTLFSGEVADIYDQQRGLTRVWRVTCHDNNILLDEVVIASASYGAGAADSAIIDDLFDTYRPDIDGATHVATVDDSMEAVSWTAMTLREILDDICGRTGGRYYVDADLNLHYFDAETNPAAWGLSTSPNGSTTKGYGGFRRVRNAARLANKVLVDGKGIAGWVEDAGSIAAYGERHAVSRDQRITTSQGVTDRGDAILDRYDLPRVTYELWTENDGLHAGMSVELTNEVWGIASETVYIRSLRMEIVGMDGGRRRYTLQLGDSPSSFARAERHLRTEVGAIQQGLGEVTESVFDGDAPAAPTALGAGNVATGVGIDADGHQIVYAQISWASVADADLDHYELQLSTSSDFSTDLQTRLHPAGGQRLERFVGLLGNTTYYVRVRAVDWVGNQSAWDYGAGSPYSFTTAKDTTAPAQVSGLSAASSRTLIGLSWTANSEADLRHYEIQRAPDSSGSPGAYATIAYALLSFYIDQDFSDAQIAAGNTFWYRVRAIDTSANAGNWSTADSAQLGQIGTDHIAAQAITAAKIAANTITANQIAAGTITATQIASSTITADRLNVSTLSAIAANMGTLTAGEIRVGTGTVGSNFTGFRVYSSYIGGFDNNALQVGIRSSDGVLVFAGGNGTLDANGMQLARQGAAGYGVFPTGAGIMWTDCAAVGAFNDTAISREHLALRAGDPSGPQAGYLSLNAHYGPDVYARMRMEGYYPSAGVPYIGFDVETTTGVLYLKGNGAYINDSANANMTLGMTINQGAADDEALALKSSDVAHGMTTHAETDTYAVLKKSSPTAGGLAVYGYRDADSDPNRALMLVGRLAEAAETAKTTAATGVVALYAQIKTGTDVTSVGADGNLFTIHNHGTTRFIFDAEGSAHADVEWTTFDEYDDVALLTDLERAMLAQRDPVKGAFVDFLRYNHATLEAAGIVHFDRENPGHAMLNTTRLSMLLVGALRQIGDRVARIEQSALLG